MDAAAHPDEGERTAQRRWLPLVLVLLGLWALVAAAQRAPAPRGPDAPLDTFSEARAHAVVRKLADDIGPHPIGSPAFSAAAEYLAAELRKLPRVEVELQEAEGDNRLAVWTGVDFHYRVRNVLARLPGRRPDAILINAHCDSPAEAPGATDNGIGTAAALETMRALAAAPQLEWTVVLSLNGGEEAGSVGAAGFTQHRWARDARVFLDTDGSGTGKAAMIQASARVPALLRAYARVAPAPQASIFHNDLAQSGLLGQSGDFEPLERLGIPGLDFAALGDIWAVHTHLDVSTRLSPGTLQHLGDTFLAVTRELAQTAPELTVQAERTVYYDLLGQTLVVYSMGTARVLALAALVLLGVALRQLVRSRAVTGRQITGAAGGALLAALAGLLAGMVSAGIVSALRPAHGWFVRPVLAVPAFLFPGLCAVLAVHAWRGRRARARGVDAEATARAAWAGGLLCWGVLLALFSVGSVGLGYLALWWVGPSALALWGGIAWPRARWSLFLVSVVLGMLGFVQLAVHMVPPLIALSGMFPGPPPAELRIAAFLWFSCSLPLALCGFAELHRGVPLRRAIAACAGLAGLGVLLTVLLPSYTAARPKRVLATHAQHGDRAALLLLSMDSQPLDPALTDLADAQPLPASERWPNALLPPGWLPPYSHALPAPPLTAPPVAIPPPRLEVLSRTEDAQAGTRTLKLRLHASGWMTSVDIPRAALAGWSLGESIPEPSEGMTAVTAAFYAPSPAGQEFTLQLRGPAPVEITVRQNHAPGQTPALTELRRRLPAWVTINASALHVVTQPL